MLDLASTQKQCGMTSIKIFAVYLTLLISSMFVLPVSYGTIDGNKVLFWRWSYYTSEASFLFTHFLDGNIQIGSFITFIDYIPDITCTVLAFLAIIAMVRLYKAGKPERIWHSGFVLGGIFINLARSAWACSSVIRSFLIDMPFSSGEYNLSIGITMLIFSQDEVLLCIIILYLTVFAWKNYNQ